VIDERRIEQVLREGPPFATAYVARPLRLDEAIAEHRGLTARPLALALLTTVLLLAATLAAIVALGLLRPANPGPLAIIRNHTIYLHPAEGSPERQILPGAPDGYGGWCPDLSAVLRGSSICGLVQHVAISADGRHLVLSVYRTQPSEGSESNDLYVVNADGSGLRLVHHEPTGQFDFALAPDGHRLAYTAGLPQAHGTRMGILDLDSGEEIALPDGGSPMMWSPDGERIAYVLESYPASDDETWIVDASGKDPRFVGNYLPLAWTADSRSLFVTRSFGPPYVPPELVAIDDSSPPAQVWHLGSTDSLAPSPDGRMVAIVQTTDHPGQLRIVLADRDGSDPVVISPIKADGARVCWSADGRWLFWLVSHSLSPEAEFFAYDVVDASMRMLAHAHTTSERAIYAPGCG
jgi:Tol biopolymer transport system component